jgi:hypothetical protein
LFSPVYEAVMFVYLRFTLRFFGFGGPIKKKISTSNAPNPSSLHQQQVMTSLQQQGFGALGQRRGSDRSLSGSVHELTMSGVKDMSNRVSHSHSQSNLSDIPYRWEIRWQKIKINRMQVWPQSMSYYQENLGARIQFIISETACQWIPINISKGSNICKNIWGS